MNVVRLLLSKRTDWDLGNWFNSTVTFSFYSVKTARGIMIVSNLNIFISINNVNTF